MQSPETILVPLAPGFEEIELTTIVDVLRRAELDVTLAGTVAGPITGAHGIAIQPEAEIAALDLGRFTMIVLAGGQPGTTNLRKDERVLDLVRRLAREGRRTAAICAAPVVLHDAGILDGVPVTSHPSVRAQLTRAKVLPDTRVVRSGPIVTSQGAGTALEFALALVADLCGTDRSAELAAAMRV
jgi:4-methyl-5(b-hydroxyethyl)-thiazole monophosphate biosynthesis